MGERPINPRFNVLNGYKMNILNPYRFNADGYDPDYQAILDEATSSGFTLPSSDFKDAGNDFMIALKSIGAFDHFDEIYLMKDDGDLDFGTINWISPTDKIDRGTNNTDKPDNTGWNFQLGGAMFSPYKTDDAKRKWGFEDFIWGHNLLVSSSINTGSKLVNIKNSGGGDLVWARELNGSLRLHANNTGFKGFGWFSPRYPDNKMQSFFRDGGNIGYYHSGVTKSQSAQLSAGDWGSQDVKFFETGSGNGTIEILFTGAMPTDQLMEDLWNALQDYRTVVDAI